MAGAEPKGYLELILVELQYLTAEHKTLATSLYDLLLP